jgi:hypothetical protein
MRRARKSWQKGPVHLLERTFSMGEVVVAKHQISGALTKLKQPEA